MAKMRFYLSMHQSNMSFHSYKNQYKLLLKKGAANTIFTFQCHWTVRTFEIPNMSTTVDLQQASSVKLLLT